MCLFDDEEIDFNDCSEFQIDCEFENVRIIVCVWEIIICEEIIMFCAWTDCCVLGSERSLNLWSTMIRQRWCQQIEMQSVGYHDYNKSSCKARFMCIRCSLWYALITLFDEFEGPWLRIASLSWLECHLAIMRLLAVLMNSISFLLGDVPIILILVIQTFSFSKWFGIAPV